MAIIAHMMGDAFNNIGIIISAVVIWKWKHPARFYIDPVVSMLIAFMIFATAIPVCKRAGYILMESAPASVRLEDVKKSLTKIPGVLGINKVHVWSLNNEEILASVCVQIHDSSLGEFERQKKLICESLSTYGICNATIQPELMQNVRPQEATPLRQPCWSQDLTLSRQPSHSQEPISPRRPSRPQEFTPSRRPLQSQGSTSSHQALQPQELTPPQHLSHVKRPDSLRRPSRSQEPTPSWQPTPSRPPTPQQ